MPRFDKHHAQEICKILLVGHPGSGKTGAIPAIINEKQVERIIILDFDNGLDIMHQYLEPWAREHVYFETLTDMMKPNPNGPPFPPSPRAYAKSMKLLDRFKTDEHDLGAITSWGPETLLVIDSLTMMGACCMHHVKSANGALLDRDWQYYGPAMEMQQAFLELIFSDSVACNIIMTAHIIPIYEKKRVEAMNQEGKTSVQSVDVGDAKNFPSALGNKLPPKVGRFFNAVLRINSRGSGGGLRKFISTITDNEIELKNPAPNAVPREIPLDGGKGGLATYFRIVREVAKGAEKTGD